jgi:hypothetical protein
MAQIQYKLNEHDARTAASNPVFGEKMQNYIHQWHQPGADQDAIKAAAEQLRLTYGGYTTNADGSVANYVQPGRPEINRTMDQIGSFGPFSYDKEAPAYDNRYGTQQQQLLDGLLNRPDYDNQYQQYQQQLLDSIINRPDFSWSKDDDPQWSSYAKQYRREGDRAQANALAQASAASGGRPSSFAATAASQAGDYYASRLSDVIPQLYQQAYNRYLNEFSMKHQNLGAVNSMEQTDYQRYLDDYMRQHSNLGMVNDMEQADHRRFLSDRDQFNADRNLAFNVHQSDYNMLNNYLGQLQGRQAVDTDGQRRQEDVDWRNLTHGDTMALGWAQHEQKDRQFGESIAVDWARLESDAQYRAATLAQNAMQFEAGHTLDWAKFNSDAAYRDGVFMEGIRQFEAVHGLDWARFNSDVRYRDKVFLEGIRQFNASHGLSKEIAEFNMQMAKKQLELDRTRENRLGQQEARLSAARHG